MIRILLPLLLASHCFAAGFSESLAFKGQAPSGGSSLASGVAAFFPLDEFATTATSGTNRLDAVGGLVWLDKNNNIASIRGVGGGAAVEPGNSALNYLSVTNAIFDQGSGKSFTVTFWFAGGNGGYIGERTSTAAGDYDYYCDLVGGGNTFSAFANDLAGNPHQATTTNTIPLAVNTAEFQFCAFGFDNAAQQWWVSCNATPKNPVACTSVRATGGRGFICIPHLGIIDEVGYWTRSLTQTELTNLYNGGFGDTYPFGKTAGYMLANAYGWQVTNNSGTISTTTYAATKTLCDGMATDGTLSKFSLLMGMPNETLPGAVETIVCSVYETGIGGAARQIDTAWTPNNTRHNFVNGDVSVNGITGNGVNKWINLCPFAGCQLMITNPCDSGAVIYCYTATASSGVEFAAEDGFAPTAIYDYAFKINSTFGGAAGYGPQYTTKGFWGYDNSIAGTTQTTAGYYSIQRSAQNSLSLYFANSLNAHSLLMSTNANMTSCSQSRSGVFPLFCYYDGNLCGGCNFSVNTISVFGINHVHLTSTDSANVYARFQTYRTALGGGFQ